MIADPKSPFERLRVITNEAGAASYFEGLMRRFGIPGEGRGEVGGVTYLALIQEGDWSLAREDLVRALETDWPGSVVEAPAEPRYETEDVSWTHGTGLERIDGSAHENGQAIYLDGQVRSVARFAAWYRTLVPAEYAVVLCDEGYNFDAVIPPGADAEQVLTLIPQ